MGEVALKRFPRENRSTLRPQGCIGVKLGEFTNTNTKTIENKAVKCETFQNLKYALNATPIKVPVGIILSEQTNSEVQTEVKALRTA